jgi:hypothetical protein
MPRHHKLYDNSRMAESPSSSSFSTHSASKGNAQSLSIAPYMDENDSMTQTTHSRRQLTMHLATRYRQLISCAVTRQLLDPRLTNYTDKDEGDAFAKCEITDRRQARERVKMDTQRLGTSWGRRYICEAVEYTLTTYI